MFNQDLMVHQFVGRLTADPMIKETPGGKSVLTFTLAFNGRHKTDAEGSFTSFISVEAWEKLAEFYAGKLTKGMQVVIKGSLVQNRWLGPDQSRRSTMKLVANTIQVTDLKRRPVVLAADSAEA